MSVHQLKDGRWFVKYSRGTNPDDPNRTREYFGRGPEAQEAAVQRNLALGMGNLATPGGVLFRQLMDHYLTAKRGSIAATTESDAIYKLGRHILPFMGSLAWSEIRPELLDRYVVARQAKVKMSTIHRELAIVRAIIRLAVRRRLIPMNPMENYQFPKRERFILSPPTSAELAALYAAAAPHLQRAIMLGYYTAMRPGRSELLALRWEQVDLINGTIFVQSAKKGGMDARTVPINGALGTLLRTWRDEDLQRGPLGTVVHYLGRPISQFSSSWRQAKERAGITRRIRPYDLRHMAATAMLEAGADLKSVSETLGHASPNMTLTVYQHTSTALRRDAVSRLSNPIFGNQLPECPENISKKTKG